MRNPSLRVAFPFAMIAAMSPMATDLYLPAIPAIAEALSADIQVVEMSISTYMLGFAAGHLLAAPISDRLGRRPVTFAGLVLFLAATLLILACQSVDQLLALRLLQGIGGGACAVNVMASIGDLFAEKDAALIYSKIHMIVLVAPLVAPTIGAVLIHYFNWEASFVFLSLYALLVMVLARRFITETLQPDDIAVSNSGVIGAVAADFWQALRRPLAVWFNLVTAFAFGCFFVFLTDAAFLFIDYFGQPTHYFPFFFGVCILALALGNQLNLFLISRFSVRRVIPAGHTLQVLSAVTLLVYVTTSAPDLRVLLPLVTVTVAANALIVGNATARYISLFKKRRGTASAIAGVLQFTTGAVVSIGISFVHDGTPRTMAIGMLATAMISAAATLRIAWAERLPRLN